MIDKTNSENTALKQNYKFISNLFMKALWPCMLSILSSNINVIVDGILVGHKLGNSALASINLCLPLFLFMCVIGSFIASGTAINASKAIGQGNSKKGNEYYKISVLLAVITSLVVTALGFIFINKIVDFLGNNVFLRAYVYEYSFISIAGTLPKILIYIPFWYLRLDGRNRDVSIMMSILTFGNILLDIMLVYIFNFGVFGAGLASIIATSVAFGYGAACLMDNESSFYFNFKIDKSLISYKNIVSAGIPNAFNNLCATVKIIIINSILLSFGGGTIVAVFTAVNGIYGIGECIVLGVPQAATAMLGVYTGEKDNKSCELLLKTEIRTGFILSVIFTVITLVFSPVLQIIYRMEGSIFIPLLWMCLSIYPAMICNMMSSYYNIYGKQKLSVSIIFLRVILFTYICLKLNIEYDFSIFSFLLTAEILTLITLYAVTGIFYLVNKNLHRFMLCNLKHDQDGKTLNFSIVNDAVKICEACELITEFCESNGLSPRETMKIQLAMEEAMVLISDINKSVGINFDGFDLRAFNIASVKGIRIRYDGVNFNPFDNPNSTDDYMGIRMVRDLFETVTYQRTFGINTLILLMKEL